MPKTIYTNQVTFSFPSRALWISANCATRDGMKEEDFFFPRLTALGFLDDRMDAMRMNFGEVEHYLHDTEWHGREVILDRYDERSNCKKYFIHGVKAVEFDKNEVAVVFEDGKKWRFTSSAMQRGYSFTPFFKFEVLQQARDELRAQTQQMVKDALAKNF